MTDWEPIHTAPECQKTTILLLVYDGEFGVKVGPARRLSFYRAWVPDFHVESADPVAIGWTPA